MSCTSDNCSSGADVRLRDKGLGGVYRFQFPITKDGVTIPWTGIDSVSLVFKRPDGTVLSPVLATESGTAGTWYYDTPQGFLDAVGYWNLSVTVTDGTIIIEWPYDISFRVRDQ